MVKEVVGYFVFADAKEQYAEAEYGSIYHELFGANGFDDPDTVLLHGGPGPAEEEKRYEAFSDIMEHVSSEPHILHTGGYNDTLEEDGFQNTEQVSSHSTREEAHIIAERAQQGDKVIAVTNDYHVPRTEALLNQHLDDSIDYLVAGAEWDADENRYASKWRSEALSEALPQGVKDAGKAAKEYLGL